MHQSLINKIKYYVQNNWLEIYGPKPTEIDIIKLSFNKNPWGKIIYLVFDQVKRMPVLSLKITRDQNISENIEKKNYNKVSPDLPVVYKIVNIAGWTVLVETFVPGKSLLIYYRQNMQKDKMLLTEEKSFVEVIKHVQSWHETTKKPITLTKESVGLFIFKPFERYQSAFQFRMDECKLYKYLMEEAKKLIGEQINLVPQHGDLCFGNIIQFHNNINLIDWEFYEEESLAG